MATRGTWNSLRRGLLPTIACTLLGCPLGGTCAVSDESVQAVRAASNGPSAPGRAAASLHERRNGNYAFNEGWALYAEGLGQELGIYADPYTWFGRLSLDSLRACRLVVDTGLHSFEWSRAQAIDYLIAHAHVDPGFAEAEVDRYLVWPGQADSYEVGEHSHCAPGRGRSSACASTSASSITP